MIGATRTAPKSMSTPDPDTAAQSAPEPEGVFAVPRDTTPTWEVELLLSGALVFSMMQVPAFLDDALFAARPRVSSGLSSIMIMLYFYLKMTSYALIGTFVLHLSSRAIWVAALGLRSVYPDGVLWDKLSKRPVYRDYARRTTPTLDAMIATADNRASLVFAFGLLLVLMSIAIMVFTMLVVVPAGLIEQWLRGAPGNAATTVIFVGFILVPSLLVTIIDRRFGAHLRDDHPLRRWMHAVYRMNSALVWGRITHPILLTLFSRMGMARGNLLLVGLLYSLIGVIVLEVAIRTNALSLPGETYLPADGRGRELRSAHYASSRTEREALSGVPFIPSEIVRGPYLKLFVAYVPRRLDAAIERDCPAVVRAQQAEAEDDDAAADSASTEALLECAAMQLYPLTLDGEPLSRWRYDLGRDARSGLRGFVAMLNVRELGPGRHELRISQPVPVDGKPADRPPWIIPFWR